VEEGARRSGRTPQRADWRLVREVYVAPTDAEAKRRVRDGALGRCWREYLLPFYVLASLAGTTGGFGTLLAMIYDFSGEASWWDESLRLLTKEVMPHFPD
jgi:hypothetical protein